ncbi:hypothetical protein D3C76_878810 [compost metagenome]
MRLADPEQAQLVLHRAAGQACYPQTDFKGVGKCRQGEKVRRRADHKTDNFPFLRVQTALLLEECLDGGVEVAVHRGTGDMAVEVTVLPAREDRLQVGIVVALRGIGHGWPVLLIRIEEASHNHIRSPIVAINYRSHSMG